MRFFKVSARWMKACGKGDKDTTFPIKSIDYNLAGGQGFDSFVTVETPAGPWIVAAARGEFIA